MNLFPPWIAVHKRAAIAFLAIVLVPLKLAAFELNVVDQHGNPVKDAFIAIPQGEILEPGAEHQIMDQVDRQFVPHVLAISKGQSVIFPNSDNIRHHVYSFSEPKKFEIELYEGVPKQPILFDKPGLVALGCNIHDSMLGYILVSPWPEYVLTNETGVVTLSKSVDEVAVWHPWLKGQKAPVLTKVEKGEKDAQISLNLTQPQPVKQFKGFRKRYDD